MSTKLKSYRQTALLTCLEQIHSQDLNVSNSKYAFHNVNKNKDDVIRNPGKYAQSMKVQIYQTRCRRYLPDSVY